MSRRCKLKWVSITRFALPAILSIVGVVVTCRTIARFVPQFALKRADVAVGDNEVITTLSPTSLAATTKSANTVATSLEASLIDASASSIGTAVTTTSIAAVTTYADAGRTCAEKGLQDALQAECEKACSSLPFAKHFSTGSWENSPGCFVVVSGRFEGNCHWNVDSWAMFYAAENRAVCIQAPAKLDYKPSAYMLRPPGQIFDDYFKEYFNKQKQKQQEEGRYKGPKLLGEVERVHNCTKHDIAPLGKIPQLLHTVMLSERGSWVNKTDASQLISRLSPEYKSHTFYEQLLVENIRHSIYVNEFAFVHFLDDAACLKLLGKWSRELVAVFEQQGSFEYKADICRIAALYYQGGYYFDDDMFSYRSVVPLVHSSTDFATAIGANTKDFFQSFLAAAPCHPVLRRNLEMFAEVMSPGFDWLKQMQGYIMLLGPATLTKSYDEINAQRHTTRSQMFREVRAETSPDNWMRCRYYVKDAETEEKVFCSRLGNY